MSECSLYNIIKWGVVCVWMLLIWYYWNESCYMAEFSSNVIIKLIGDICLNVLYMILLKLVLVYVWMPLYGIIEILVVIFLNALYM